VSDAVARVLERLGAPVRTRDGWVARCPAHHDTRPSLAVSEGADARALVTCRAGCRTADVLIALGLGWSDLFASPPARREARARRLPAHDPAYHVRQVVLAEARRQQVKRDQYAELWAEADSIRICDRVMRQARTVATQLGPREDVWHVLAQAAALETLTRAAEARLHAAA